jgi:hypothetical protein
MLPPRHNAAACAATNAQYSVRCFNKSKAAKTLVLTRRQLYVRMQKYGFE